jgi:capsule biosynthesis phosphatase
MTHSKNIGPKNRYVMDLDGTLTIDDKSFDYTKKPLNSVIAKGIKAAVKQGYAIDVFTARNMRSFNGDLEKINSITKPIADTWLKQHKIPHENLIMGKPWCGEDGFYVDDKNLSLEEFIFRTIGPFAGSTVDVVVPFYNEELNIGHAHAQLKRLERLLGIKNYIYVNNGSRDTTGKMLDELATQDKKVKVVHIVTNQGYGHGMKNGIAAATADWVMTNHADGQFDGYTYILTHMADFMKMSGTYVVLPRRLNRPRNWAFRTKVLRLLASLLSGQRLGEFNGQPKIWPRAVLQNNVINLPDDFCFDLAVYMALKHLPVVDLPILEKSRHKGVSSWAGQASRTLRLSLRYLMFAWQSRFKA